MEDPGAPPAETAFRIVEAQAKTFQVTGWSICLHFDQTGASIPNGSYLGNAVVLQPFGRTNQLSVEPRHVHLPMSVIEIEFMITVIRSQ